MPTDHPIDRVEELLAAIREHSGLSDEEIIEAGEHGADAGWAGFTWYDDCSDFVRVNREAIWELLADTAEEAGYPNVPAFVATFTRADMADSEIGFDCLLSWFALETVGRWLVGREERNPYPDDNPVSRLNATENQRERGRIRNGV